jgi:hypothetical protein
METNAKYYEININDRKQMHCQNIFLSIFCNETDIFFTSESQYEKLKKRAGKRREVSREK